MTSTKDFYIDFLKQIQETPMSYKELKKKYPDHISSLWKEIIDNHLLTQGEDKKYMLSFEARFKLLEYEELREARLSSKEARVYAIIAIIISSVIGIVQIVTCI